MSRVPVKCCGQRPFIEEKEDEGKVMFSIFCPKCSIATWLYHDLQEAYKSWDEVAIYNQNKIGAYQHSDMVLLGKVKKKRLFVKVALVGMVIGFTWGAWFYFKNFWN
jgi:hypothetical protein